MILVYGYVLGSCIYWFRTLIVAREAECMRRVRGC
jgi:hypothetical protein